MNALLEPPEGFDIELDRDAGPAERPYVLKHHGFEVSRHKTRGAALLAAETTLIQKQNHNKSPKNARLAVQAKARKDKETKP